MTRMTRLFAAFVTAGCVALPIAANAQAFTTASPGATAGSSAAAPAPAYGSSGQTVGTVTAPSVGSYNRPSVGVTNSVPTWNNTNPPAK